MTAGFRPSAGEGLSPMQDGIGINAHLAEDAGLLVGFVFGEPLSPLSRGDTTTKYECSKDIPQLNLIEDVNQKNVLRGQLMPTRLGTVYIISIE